jgi:hypothetical protein
LGGNGLKITKHGSREKTPKIAQKPFQESQEGDKN